MIFSGNRCPPSGQVLGQAFSGSCFDTSAAFLPDGYGAGGAEVQGGLNNPICQLVRKLGAVLSTKGATSVLEVKAHLFRLGLLTDSIEIL